MRRMRRYHSVLASAVVVIAVGGGIVWTIVRDEPARHGALASGPRSTAPLRLQLGAESPLAEPHRSGPPFVVGTAVVTMVDPARSTPGRGATPPSATRALPVTVRYPSRAEGTDAPGLAGSFPIVVFAHGFALADFTYPRFLHDLAAEGFVVVDPELPLSSAARPGPAIEGDEVNQARDLGFVVDQLLDPATRPTVLRGMDLGTPVAAVGHSDGGITAVGFAANSCCADARVGAAVILSGALAYFPGSWYTTVAPPTLVVHGDADEVNPLGSSATVYAAARSPKMFVVVHGGHHISAFESDASRPAVVRVVADFLRAHLLHDPSAAARLPTDVAADALELRASE